MKMENEKHFNLLLRSLNVMTWLVQFSWLEFFLCRNTVMGNGLSY